MKKSWLALIFILVILFLAGCGATKNKNFNRVHIVPSHTKTIFSPEEKFLVEIHGDFEQVDGKIKEKQIRKISEMTSTIPALQDFDLKKNFIFKAKSEDFMVSVFIDSVSAATDRQLWDTLHFEGKPYFYYLQEEQGRRLLLVSSKNERLEDWYGFHFDNSFIMRRIKFNSTYEIDAENPFISLSQLFFKSENDTLNYIAPLEWLERYRNFYIHDNNDWYGFVQAAATYSCPVKNYPPYLKYKEAWCGTSQKKRRFRSTDFSDTIKHIAQANDILVFNENHFMSKHRILVTAYLEELYRYGYRYLALEALAGDLAPSQKCAVKGDGMYTCEPEMANLIHKALELGYELIYYEEEEGDGTVATRERNQTQNILKKWDGDKGKMIVFCGFGHISLKPDLNMMAYQLKNALEPDKKLYTINQVAFDCQYSAAIRENSVKVIYPDSSILVADRFQNDLYIVNNLVQLTSGKIFSVKKHTFDKRYRPLKNTDIPYFYAYYLFVYRERDFEKYGSACIPAGIYFMDGKSFDISIPEHEPVLLQVRNWNNEVVYSHKF